MKKTRKVSKKEIAKYMGLPYTYEVVKEDNGYFISVKELNGCMADGETLEEAMNNIEISKRLWIETMLSKGKEIPLPEDQIEYSGKILLRLPKSLHHKLATRAKEEEISLNQYIVSLLSENNAINILMSNSKRKQKGNNSIIKTVK